MSDAVRSQYENYPYPPRDPADEARRLITGSPSHLLEINHFLFSGKRDFSRPFRVLVAGGGTGDATVMLAQQLTDAGANATLVHFDISEASAAVARARIAQRGLTNVAFVRGAIEDLPGLGLGPFDYIDCCGVIHHLEDPLAGLTRLAEVLAPDGGMGAMVYAPLGRTGVYHVQSLLRMLAEDVGDEVRIDLARRLLDGLPETNWLQRNPLVADHKTLGDAGIYDLLLHARDRAYTVVETAELVAQAGLRLVTFMDPLRYEPAIYLRDEDLNRRVKDMPWLKRCMFAELLAGNMKTHVFYAVRSEITESTVASPSAPDAVPVLHDLDGLQVAQHLAKGHTLRVELDGLKLSFNMPELAPPIFGRIGGNRTLADIHADINREAGGKLPWEAFLEQFHRMFVTANGLGRLYLTFPPGAAAGKKGRKKK